MHRHDWRSRDLIGTRLAWRMTARRILSLAGSADPYPVWTPDEIEIETWCSGDVATFIRRRKAARRAQRHLQHALAAGAIDACFLDPPSRQPIPSWAWTEDRRCIFAWSEGRLPLNVLLPDPWPRWSSHRSFLSRHSLARWYWSELPSLAMPPDSDPVPAVRPLELVKGRPLPDRPYVELAEALSWLAFGISLNANDLWEALTASQLDVSTEAIECRLAEAVEFLADAIIENDVHAFGRHVPGYLNADDVLTEPIDPIRLMDYRRFDIVSNSLRFGKGLTTRVRGDLTDILAHEGRRDMYRDVRLLRTDLARRFATERTSARDPSDENPDKPLPDAKLLRWLEAVGPNAANMTQTELLSAVRAAYPQYAVSRKRIRDLTSGRKPGPKPMPGK